MSSRLSRKPKRMMAPRSSSPTPVASPTATTWSTASSSRNSPSNPVTGPLCVTTPRSARLARIPSSLTPRRPPSGSRITPIAKPVTPCWPAAIPNWPLPCSKKHRTMSSANGASTRPGHPCPDGARLQTSLPWKKPKTTSQQQLPEVQSDRLFNPISRIETQRPYRRFVHAFV